MDAIKTSLRAFLARHFQSQVVQDDDDIFALGFVNSLFAMQLILFVEQEFGIAVENDDLDIANFRSVAAMAHLVARKKGLSYAA